MKKYWVFLVLILFVLLGYVWARFKQVDMNPDLNQSELLAEVMDCDLSRQACATHGYQLVFERPVRPLTLLKAHLVTERPLESAVLYLEMKDMDMGINRFIFRPMDNGGWVADIMIPVCATGRRDWLASLIIHADGQTQRLVFPFTVEGR
jgi:hypothetical protein